MAEPRQCFFIPIYSNKDGHGFVPSLVIEGEAGHTPLSGNPAEFQTPWYSGKTYKEACATCDAMNRKRYGLTPAQSMAILLSSMFQGKVKQS